MSSISGDFLMKNSEKVMIDTKYLEGIEEHEASINFYSKLAFLFAILGITLIFGFLPLMW
jgi:hypothetical protein